MIGLPNPDAATRLKPRPLYEEVAELLRQRIYTQELAPGSWIDELKLAEAYGISRTPLREAIKVLAAEGLVTMKMRRGAYVTEISEKDVSDVYQLLALLEADAAAVVAERATDVQLAELEALHDELTQAVNDRERFFKLNEQFHERLLTIADNPWRMQLVRDLRKVMKLSRHHSLFKQGRVQASLVEHGALLQALQQRNPEAAAQQMKNHFAQGLIATHSVRAKQAA